MNGRTASCTATRSVSGLRLASAFSTDCWRVSPPSTTRTGFCGMFLMNQAARPIDILGAQRHHDLGDGGAAQELADGMDQDGRAFKQHELFAAGAGFLPAHARAQTPRPEG